jgi:hypothetical protein
VIKLPPASHHVKRHLQPRELATIALALELLARQHASAQLDELRAGLSVDCDLLSDDDMRALAFELTRARKVKVCRTKQRAS